MRPVKKKAWPDINGVPKSYNPHTKAKKDVEDNLGKFCSYCEIFVSDGQVEHAISQHQDVTLKHNWDNFLLGCGRCNGSGNKGKKPVDFQQIHFPHINNTLLSFTYLDGGVIVVNNKLKGRSHDRAKALFELVGLDKLPGHPKTGYNDTRWIDRREAWRWAKMKLSDYRAGKLNATDIVDFAIQRGFFSVWFTVFNAHLDVRRELCQRFLGTCLTCFNADYLPIPRNPTILNDPI